MRTNTTVSASQFFGDVFWGDSSGCTQKYTIAPSYPFNVTTPSFDRLEDLIARTGTPWDNVGNFPPFDVDVHTDTGAVRFRFALSGVDPDTVDIQFSDGKIWLVIDKQPERDEAWKPIKHKIKGSVQGKYFYQMDLEKFDYRKAEAKWTEGVLEVIVPLKEDQQPFTLKVSR